METIGLFVLGREERASVNTERERRFLPDRDEVGGLQGPPGVETRALLHINTSVAPWMVHRGWASSLDRFSSVDRGIDGAGMGLQLLP